MNINSPPKKKENNNATDMNEDDDDSSFGFASPCGKEESTATNGKNNASSEDNANDFYKSTEFYDGLKDAMKAARMQRPKRFYLSSAMNLCKMDETRHGLIVKWRT